MRKSDILVRSTLVAVVFLASCSIESPTGTGPPLDGPSLVQLAKNPGSCVFLTPNGKSHTVPATSSRCAGLDVKDVAGIYELTQLIIVEVTEGVVEEPFDVALAEGVVFRLTLHPNGRTSGSFYVPPSPGEEGSGIDVSLDGTWSLDGNKVTLDHLDETVIEEIEYTYEDGKLIGRIEGFDDMISIDIVLTQR